MLGFKIHIVIFSILTNQIICTLLREGNEDAKNTEKIDMMAKPLYEEYPRNIFYGPKMQELQSSHRSLESPILLSLGFGKLQDMNYNREKALYSRYPSDFPVYRPQNQNHMYRTLSYVPYYSFDSSGDKELLYFMEPSYFMGIGFEKYGNLRFPVHFLMTQPPEIEYTGPVLSSEMKNHDLGLPSTSPHIEILKSIGYSLPPETTYHPTTNSKDYFIGVPPPSTTKPHNYDMQSLLLGEQEVINDGKEHDEKEIDQGYVIDNPSDENDSPSFRIRPSQYYHSNTKPITFEQRMREPKNIYEIISSEKIVPKEIDMTVHIKRYQGPTPNWKPAAGMMAEGSDVIPVESSDHENGTFGRNGNNANEQVRNDEEILLTSEAVEKVAKEDNSSGTEKHGNDTKLNAELWTQKGVQSNDDLNTETQLKVVSVSESENVTNNIIDF